MRTAGGVRRPSSTADLLSPPTRKAPAGRTSCAPGLSLLRPHGCSDGYIDEGLSDRGYPHNLHYGSSEISLEPEEPPKPPSALLLLALCGLLSLSTGVGVETRCDKPVGHDDVEAGPIVQ